VGFRLARSLLRFSRKPGTPRKEFVMKIEQLMNRAVRTCSKHDSLERAAQVMWECDTGCLVVVDAEERPIGMITDRDALMAAYTQGVLLREASVGSAMSRRLETCLEGSSLEALEQLMQKAQIRRVPVVNVSGRLVGIITLSDVARFSQWSANRFTHVDGLARTLSAITSPRTSVAPEPSHDVAA
jgi:CBS-domain-containing membrane protein